jgi:hypothetical protein
LEAVEYGFCACGVDLEHGSVSLLFSLALAPSEFFRKFHNLSLAFFARLLHTRGQFSEIA